MGGTSLDILRGGPVKKNTLYNYFLLDSVVIGELFSLLNVLSSHQDQVRLPLNSLHLEINQLGQEIEWDTNKVTQC